MPKIGDSITIIIVISITNITDVFNRKDNENIKDKNKENVITVFIENNKRDITIKNDIKSLRTIIGILFA